MTNGFEALALVALGAFAGAIARYGMTAFASRTFTSSVPYGTLTVNLLGSFLLGMLAGANAGEGAALLVGTGFLGAFTTFSTLKLEAIKLLRAGRWRAVAFYYGMTYGLGLTLAYAGLCAAKFL